MADKNKQAWSDQKSLQFYSRCKKTWVGEAAWTSAAAPATVLVDLGQDLKPWLKELPTWEQNRWKKNSTNKILRFSMSSGPLWVVRPQRQMTQSFAEEESLSESNYTQYRQLFGQLESQLRDWEAVLIDFGKAPREAILGALVGLEMAAYRFRDWAYGRKTQRPSLHLKSSLTGKQKASLLKEASDLAGAVNMARHLVNLPPQTLHPQSYSALLKKCFANEPTLKVEVWNQERLKKEGMGMMLAVGAASDHPPCLVRLRYRPSKKSTKKPVAFVGKGITFDSGGLDIKPASAMRWMKKDMGGSAAVVGLCHWVVQSQLNQACDFYLALAENSVSGSAFAPGDILASRSGQSVEVHHTDAEGRLVLADALDVAVTTTGKDAAEWVIDVATLTGAIKVGLGCEVGGLFTNDSRLSKGLITAAQERGDYFWQMPLVQSMRPQLQSRFADLTNCIDGFGGAIAAALFLESFVRQKPWAHLDIYAWKDKSEGPWSESGGSGQAVQALARFLQSN